MESAVVTRGKKKAIENYDGSQKSRPLTTSVDFLELIGMERERHRLRGSVQSGR